MIKLPTDATEEDHLALLGVLNSSTACFWLKQVCFAKGGSGIGRGICDEEWEFRFEFDSTKLSNFPLPDETPLQIPSLLQERSDALQKLIASASEIGEEGPAELSRLVGEMIYLQEELDWQMYSLYGLTENPLLDPEGEPKELRLGERAFEIRLAQALRDSGSRTSWFERHGSVPIFKPTGRHGKRYEKLVSQRLEAIASNHVLRILEAPNYKRRWQLRTWKEIKSEALRRQLQAQLESEAIWEPASPRLLSVQQVIDLHLNHYDVRPFLWLLKSLETKKQPDLSAVVTELVGNDAVPVHRVLCYKPAGLRKRKAWERTWELQRREDAIDARTELSDEDPSYLAPAQATKEKSATVGVIPVPPKYKSGDFLKSSYWSLRGKLDVPKERFISIPGAERDSDPSPVILWAGYDHAQQAQAISTYYVDRKDLDGWDGTRLMPLLVALHELMPWLKQWHNNLDPAMGSSVYEEYQGFLDEELRGHGLTTSDLEQWTPPQRPKRAKKTTAKTKTTAKAKTVRKCGQCGEPGHTKRTCPEKAT